MSSGSLIGAPTSAALLGLAASAAAGSAGAVAGAAAAGSAGGGRGRGGGGGLGVGGLGVDRLHELHGLVAALLLGLDRHEEAGVLAVDLGGVARHGGLRLGDGLRVDRRGGRRHGGGVGGRDRVGGRGDGRGRRLGDRRVMVEAAAAGEVLGEVGLAEARDLHDVAGLRRVQELVAAHRDRDVVDVARLAEEDEVAGLEVRAVDRRPVARRELRVGDARDLDARLRVGPLGEPGAVEAGLRRRAAPLVGRAGVLLRLLERRQRLRAGASASATGG